MVNYAMHLNFCLNLELLYPFIHVVWYALLCQSLSAWQNTAEKLCKFWRNFVIDHPPPCWSWPNLVCSSGPIVYSSCQISIWLVYCCCPYRLKNFQSTTILTEFLTLGLLCPFTDQGQIWHLGGATVHCYMQNFIWIDYCVILEAKPPNLAVFATSTSCIGVI